ncbi:TetR/AcrR family transcriptional regulator [Arthrobacter sp. H14]|uniref:TetR/AcrR family transcriptional regulator n=1 Tax=Arthrobacter sp. H14 TaxID=1312959 RepID=UPI00047A6FA3|nr:TetR/AcrR family transcriptional regulator [Arthrobacter sp. H14]
MSQNRRVQAVDPRVERSRRVICEAALEELAEAGYGGFTIESVATRANVGRSTVYRHWTSKLNLITDALETLNKQPAPDLNADNPHEQVEAMLRHLTAALTRTTFSSCIPALIEAAEHDQTVRDFLYSYSNRRNRTLVDVLRRGIETGDFPPTLDPELASAALAGAIFYRRLMTNKPLESSDASALAKLVLGN